MIDLLDYVDTHGNEIFAALGAASIPLMLFVKPKGNNLFGNAKFASTSDIKKAGLLGDNGIIVGKLGSRYLMFPGQQHVLVAAPTRSGKGVGVVIPNLLFWPDSTVVLDIKNENFQTTSKVRERLGNKCYLFNPLSEEYKTHRYNPLSYISSDKVFRIDDIQRIANMNWPDKESTDIIWTATPRSLFLGITLYLLETYDKQPSMGDVLRTSLIGGDCKDFFIEEIDKRKGKENELSSECVFALNTYMSLSSDKTRSGVLAAFRAALEIYMNPLVDAATSGNDFDLRDLRKKKISIYIGVTPNNLDRMRPLLNLLWQQIIDLNTRELPSQNKEIKYECLLLPDEFTSIGRMPILSKGISFIAGYGLRMMPIIQSPSQLIDTYGIHAAKNFAVNHACQIVFPPKATETDSAEAISKWLGTQTVKNVSLSKKRGIFHKDAGSENFSDRGRALLLPQEIVSLGKDAELIIVEDTPPILAKRIRFYEEHPFIDRLKLVSKSLNKIKGIPSRAQLDKATIDGELSSFVPVIKLSNNYVLNDVNLTYNSREVLKVDWKGIKAPGEGVLDRSILEGYADNLCSAVGVSHG